MNETLVIYHGGCRDGFCAAWVYWKYLKETHTGGEGLDWPPVVFHPGFYGQEPPDCKDKDVIIVDFCYPLEIMKNLSRECKNLIWLDHHKTAIEFHEFLEKESYQYGTTLDWRFDNVRSGAGIAWDYFFPNEPRPWLVDYVEDRDLWLHKLDLSEQINAFIACLEFDFKVWDDVNKETLGFAAKSGYVARMKTEQYIREVCKNVYFANIVKRTEAGNLIKTYGRNIPVVNIPQVDCSEVMDALLKLYPDSPFSLYWFRRPDGMYQYGMRSLKETHDFDVSAVAKLFGGGGHKNAAGFQLKYLLEELK